MIYLHLKMDTTLRKSVKRQSSDWLSQILKKMQGNIIISVAKLHLHALTFYGIIPLLGLNYIMYVSSNMTYPKR